MNCAHLCSRSLAMRPVSRLPGEALTRRAVTVITAVIFSFRVSRGCDLRHRVVDSVVDAVAAA